MNNIKRITNKSIEKLMKRALKTVANDLNSVFDDHVGTIVLPRTHGLEVGVNHRGRDRPRQRPTPAATDPGSDRPQ